MENGSFSVRTGATMALIDITDALQQAVSQATMNEGIVFLFNPHTTAGLTINEGADPAVKADIIDGLRQFVPLNHPYRHLEGNSPAHIMATLTGSSLTVNVTGGTLDLGTWQRIFFCEFDGPRTRTVSYRLLKA